MTVRCNREAFLPNEDGSFEGTGVAFYPDGLGDDPVALLASVLEQASEELGGAVGFWGPIPLPRGAGLFSIQWWDRPDDLSVLLSLVGAALADAGVGGELSPFVGASPVYEANVREPLHAVMVVLSPRLRADAAERAARRGRFAVSDIAPAALEICLDRMLRWCVVPGGVHYAQFAAASFGLGEAERDSILRRSLRTEDVATLTCERWPAERRTVTFDWQGRLLLLRGQRDGSAAPGPLLAAAAEELRAFADVADYGCAFPVVGAVTDFRSALLGNWPKLPLGTGLVFTRALEATKIPDVFPAQLLGPSHVLPSTVPGEWSVEEVGAGAHLVIPPDAESWTARGGPDIESLSRARSAFQPLLLTAEEAEEEWRRIIPGRRSGHPPTAVGD